jgi:PKHD-type hydroxylase
MFLIIKSLLTTEEVSRLTAISKEMKFVDGKLTNNVHPAKQNLQAPRDPSDALYAESTKLVSAAYARSKEFREFAYPKQMSHPLMSRYDVGMKYGGHCDAAYLAIPPNVVLRTDLSSTVFISDPASYEGGELIIHLGSQPVPIKLAAGDAVVYPSTSIHEVSAVTSGSRLVSVCFIESMLRDTHQRTQLFELNQVAEAEKDRMTWENRVRLEAAIQNLMRMWANS